MINGRRWEIRDTAVGIQEDAVGLHFVPVHADAESRGENGILGSKGGTAG
jgi:hypothetical protein